MATTRCASCTNPGTKLCKGCENVKYCSANCQKADWIYHKTLCSSFKNFQQRPTGDARRVIIFDPNKEKPEFGWLPVRQSRVGFEWDIEEYVLEYEKIITSGPPAFDYITQNPLLDVDLGYQIVLAYDDNFLETYADLNKAVRGGMSGRAKHNWKGPMVAFCGDPYGEMYALKKITDMDLNAFSALVAWLRWYPPERRNDASAAVTTNMTEEERRGAELLSGFKTISFTPGSANNTESNTTSTSSQIQAVRANCRAAVKATGVPYLEAITLAPTDPILNLPQEISKISELIGLPLALTRLPSPNPGRNPEPGDFDNMNITFMMLDCDPASPMFGWAPPKWQGGQIGNILVSRVDRKPLTSRVYDVFGDFCCNFVQSRIEAAVEGESTKQWALGEISRESWKSWVERNAREVFDERWFSG